MILSKETFDEVIDALQCRGQLTKDEIISTWSLTEDDYCLLRQGLRRNKQVDAGPKRLGGFLYKKRKGPLPVEAESDYVLLNQLWEKSTVDRLVDLLSHATMEELLGNLLQSVRQSRKFRTGQDRRGTKKELAAALVIQHGRDLLAVPEIRKAVGKAAGIETPGRWCSGKIAAFKFVGEAKLPLDLAGQAAPDSLPDYEFLNGRFRLEPLADFQVEVKEKVHRTLTDLSGRGIITLPTGAGKTRVAVETLRDFLTGKFGVAGGSEEKPTVLWLAHTEELCEQAYACFKQVWECSENVCPLLLVRFWGDYTKDLEKHAETLKNVLSQPNVLISTPQRIVNLLDGKIQNSQILRNDLVKTLGVIIVDEAHRAAAPSYRRIIAGLSDDSNGVSLLGLTATPFRMEYAGDDPERGTLELRKIFKKLIAPNKTLGNNPKLELQKRGILAEPIFKRILTKSLLRMPEITITSESGDLPDMDAAKIDDALRIRADNPARRHSILEAILPIARDSNNLILYFGPSVNDAECMAFLLRQAQISAVAISAKTRESSRRRIINEFRQGETRILCNCEVLTTGFDAPRVTHVIMARPTVSRVLYEQIIGRGLRGPRFGGTASCEIWDCEDEVIGQRPEFSYEWFRKIWQTD